MIEKDSNGFTYYRYTHRFGEAYIDGTLDIEGDLYYGL